MKIMLLSMLLVAMAACASMPTQPPTMTIHQRYEVACVSGGAAFGVITAINNLHPLKKSQQDLAAKAKLKIDERCKLAPGQDYPYTASDAVMSELEGAAATLTQIKAEVQ